MGAGAGGVSGGGSHTENMRPIDSLYIAIKEGRTKEDYKESIHMLKPRSL